MIAGKRLSAALSVLGAALVVAACASPTEAELSEAEPTDDAQEATDEGSAALEEDEDTNEVSSAVIGDEFRGRRCDRRDNFHCRRNHRGWRWVRDRGRPDFSGPEWGEGYRPGRDRWCCVRTFR